MSEPRPAKPLPIFDVQKWTLRMAVAVAFAAALLFFATPWKRPGLLLPGGVLILLGVLLRLWGVGHLRKNKVLATGGPYAFVRHPLYIGTLLIMVGLALMSGSEWVFLGLAPLALVIFFVYYAPKKERVESNRLLRIFGEDFDRYRKEVRSYFPRLTPWSGPKTKFGLEGVRINREYLITLAVAFGVAVLLLRCYVFPGA